VTAQGGREDFAEGHCIMNAFPALIAQAPTGGNPSAYILMFAMMALAFWLIIMRPQKREQQKRQALLDNLKKGDKIVTIGGVHGWITDVEKGGKTVSIRVDTKTVLKMDRQAISRVEGADPAEREAVEKGE